MTDPTVATSTASSPDEWQELVRLASPTEERNPRTTDVDLLPTADVVRLITEEDAGVADAVRAQRDRIAEAVDLAVEALRSGAGCTTWGRGRRGASACSTPSSSCRRTGWARSGSSRTSPAAWAR